MNDIYEEYFVDDIIHEVNHNERVTLCACYIGIEEKISNEDMKLLLYSALYHDIEK